MIDPAKKAFLKQINRNPTDRDLQLIFADWLDDHGDSHAAFWRGAQWLGGFSGLGGLGGRGGFGGLYSLEVPIVLIEGEDVLVFLPHGYGFSVLVGHVAKEMPHGWIVDPCCEVLDTNNGDCWVKLARGDKELRKACTYGEKIEGGFRVPLVCPSIVWQGKLPVE